jgi:hypothetical protein
VLVAGKERAEPSGTGAGVGAGGCPGKGGEKEKGRDGCSLRATLGFEEKPSTPKGVVASLVALSTKGAFATRLAY